MQSLDSLTKHNPQKLVICHAKTPQECKKSEAKLEAAIYVCMLFLHMRLKVVISGRGQGLFKKHVSLHAAIKNHVRTNTNLMANYN